MDNYGNIRCIVCGACWSAHPPDTPCVRYAPVPVGEGGPVELPAEVMEVVEANCGGVIVPVPSTNGGIVHARSDQAGR
jgi:hypothetical protein